MSAAKKDDYYCKSYKFWLFEEMACFIIIFYVIHRHHECGIVGVNHLQLTLVFWSPSSVACYTFHVVLAAGHDIKSLGINVASLCLFFLPIACYLFRDLCKEFCIVTGVSFVVAYLLPPVGWKRPHPYSDEPNNRIKIN